MISAEIRRVASRRDVLSRSKMNGTEQTPVDSGNL